MKTKHVTGKTIDSFKSGVFVWLFIVVFVSSSFSQNILIKAELIPHGRENRFRSTEETGQSTAQKLYVLYGNDFDGPSDFYLAFNLQDRQTVRYEVVDITGRPIGLGEIPDVLDQTYKVGIQVESTGIYIVRLLIDSRYYSEKVYFK
jgi:hypothetical protein